MEVVTMTYQQRVFDLSGDPEQLEQVYQAALKAGQAGAFEQAIDAGYETAPDNLLYAAWFHRLKYTAKKAKDNVVAWAWVIPLALLNAFLFWWLSGDQFTITIAGYGIYSRDLAPAIVWLAAPLAAVFVLTYLTAVGRKSWRLAAIFALALLAAAAYVLFLYPQLGTIPFQEQYLLLMIFHLPLLAWAGVGAFLVARHRDPQNRFAFLIKSLEIFIVGGLFISAGLLFTIITGGLFNALDVELPETILRLFLAGGLGLIVVFVVALFYNPTVPPSEQPFDEGISRLIALLMRLLLPLTMLVLLVYLFFIPFNFRAPFDNRDVLVVYNAMLFAIVALLAGATPLRLEDVTPRLAIWLRRGIIAVAALALLVSLYALAAILYRTGIDRLTPNRLTFIGWNIVNIGLLILLLVLQFRAAEGQWLHELHRTFSAGTVAYSAWTLVVILALPWLFGIDQMGIEELPPRVQEIIYEQADPILLKCTSSPHIYLLENGQKRWIDTIETFEERGYVWRDVTIISCENLRAIPDGVPIPTDAGPPPQP
jgi:hypothetical protein